MKKKKILRCSICGWARQWCGLEGCDPIRSSFLSQSKHKRVRQARSSTLEFAGNLEDQLRSNKVATCPGCDPSSQTGRLHWTPARPLTPLTAGGVVMGNGWTDEWMLFVESTLPKGSCIYPVSSLEPD